MCKIRTVGIRGAGLSGLSIARDLLRLHPEISISIFDVRPRLPHPQRTFCFFETQLATHTPCKSYTWSSITFRGKSFERRLDIPQTPYTMIRGDDFFSSLLSYLEVHGVSFAWNCASVDVDGNQLRIDGEIKEFDCVIDAAFRPETASSVLWQSFAGIWVETKTPFFDPSTAIMMDLQESSADTPVSFMYVLPTSSTTALVEHTTFSPKPLDPEYHLQHCHSWLEREIPGGFELKEKERGIIPMGLRTSSAKGNFITGISAGVVRPATGYAFIAAQRHARLLSEQIVRSIAKPPRIYPLWLKLGDRLFLQALLNSPMNGRALLERLLSHSPARALIAFLSGDATFLQSLSVWFCVPKVAMIRALLRI